MGNDGRVAVDEVAAVRSDGGSCDTLGVSSFAVTLPLEADYDLLVVLYY